MKLSGLLCCLLLAYGCNHTSTSGRFFHFSGQAAQQARDAASYTTLKESIRAARSSLLTGGAPAAKAYLFHIITDSLFSYWYGTPWDFNGITQIPQKGKIACGYFVTTVLRDAGLPVARVRLAQAPSSKLIEAVCAAHSIKRYSSLPDLNAYLNAQSDSALLILGLDNHVGFVQHSSGRNYFIDASCVGDQVVTKQALEDAIPVVQSRSFMIGDLLGNDVLMKQWLHQAN